MLISKILKFQYLFNFSSATAASNLDTFFATALMVEAEAEVAAAGMEEEITNTTDAEMSATFPVIFLPLSVELVVVVEMTMRPTTDKQEQFKRYIFSLGVDVM